jgi:hypothetical protein
MGVMGAAENFGSTITGRMSWAEICETYPNEWVCLVEIETVAAGGALHSARVIGHGSRVRDPLVRASEWQQRYTDVGLIFTGNRLRGR